VYGVDRKQLRLLAIRSDRGQISKCVRAPKVEIGAGFVYTAYATHTT